jgi:hypothetical protein
MGNRPGDRLEINCLLLNLNKTNAIKESSQGHVE